MSTQLPAEFHAPLGRFVASFALLQTSLESAVWKLQANSPGIEVEPGVTATRLDQFAYQIVTTELSFKRLVNAYLTLHRYRHPEDPEDFKSIASRLREIEGLRNILVHSIWAQDRKKGVAIRIKSTAKGKELKHKFEELTISYFEEAVAKVEQIGQDISQYSAMGFIPKDEGGASDEH